MLGPLLAAAAASPDATALLALGRSGQPPTAISYAELLQTARVVAADIAAAVAGGASGGRPRVCTLVDEAPDSVVVELAVLLAGGAFVPIDPAGPAARLRLLLEDACCAALVVSAAAAPAVRAKLHQAEGAATLLPIVLYAVGGGVKAMVVLDGQQRQGQGMVPVVEEDEFHVRSGSSWLLMHPAMHSTACSLHRCPTCISSQRGGRR